MREMTAITEGTGNNTDAEAAKTHLGKCRNAIKPRDFKEIPFLVKGIKYKCIELNEALVFENSNQILEYNIPFDVCVFYAYDCPVGAPRHDRNECEAIARKEVYAVFSAFKNFIITKVDLIDDSDEFCTFAVMTTLADECSIEISLRKDTGSVVFYDARGCIDNMKTNMNRK